MTKQYKFLVLVGLFIVMLYLVFSVKYEEYKVKETTRKISDSNDAVKQAILQGRDLVTYKTTKAYRNRLLKEQSVKQTTGEKVLYITSEEEYEKYTAPYKLELSEIEEDIVDPELQGLTNIEKWERFLFGK